MQILSVIKRHGYRLEDVANALGITKGSLSATINGSPNVKKLIEIALVIGCTPAEFFYDWYDNEGKEQQRPAAQQPSAQPSQPLQQPAAENSQQSQDELPLSAQPTSTVPAPLTADVAIICPHCHEAIKLGFVK